MVVERIAAVGSESRTDYEWDEAGQNHIEPDCIMSLQFTYLQKNGKLHTSQIIGSPNHKATMLDVITFKGEEEYVTEVEGLHNSSSNFKKLNIHTNFNVYTIFEAVESSLSSKHVAYKKFSFKFGALNQFGGFYGTHLIHGGITSIGVYFNHLEVLPPNMMVKTEHPVFHFDLP